MRTSAGAGSPGRSSMSATAVASARSVAPLARSGSPGTYARSAAEVESSTTQAGSTWATIR